MAEKPVVKPGDWITFGSGPIPKNATICTVYPNTSSADIEIVYLDDRDRAINEDMVWKDGKWQFKDSGPRGGYADNYNRLRGYVTQLRRGRYC